MTAAPRFCRRSPSPRYRELVDLYRRMHTEKDRVFAGLSLLLYVDAIKALIDEYDARTLLDYGSGKGRQYLALEGALPRTGQVISSVPDFWGVPPPTCYDPGYPPLSALPAGHFDGVICTDVLEHCPEDDLGWIIEELFGYARQFLFVSIACQPAVKRLPNGENAHCTVRPPSWWKARFAGAGRAQLRYEVRIRCS